MQKLPAWLGFALCIVGGLTAIAKSGEGGRLVFLSTQLRLFQAGIAGR